MRASWRNLDWLSEADRGEIEKKLAEIGGEGSSLLDRVEFVARDPAQPGALFEVRISGNVAKNQIAAVRREASAEAAFRAALEAFERSAISVWSARSAAPTQPPVPAAMVRLQPAVPQPPAPLVVASRWRPELSIPRLNLSLDPQSLFERLAQPTRGAWRAASNLLPQPTVLLRALSRQPQRHLDRDRVEALARMSWRDRLAALAMWNEVEAAERWAREQVLARRYRSELEQGGRTSEASPGWRGRIADLVLWSELEAAERWAREQVLTRLRRGPRELTRASAGQLPMRGAGRRSVGWRSRLADLSLWDALERLELHMRSAREREPRSSQTGVFAPISLGLRAAGGLVRRVGSASAQILHAPVPVRGAALGIAAVVGLSAFQVVSTENEATPSLEASYSAVSVPESWAGIDVPFSAVAAPRDWERDGTPFRARAGSVESVAPEPDFDSASDATGGSSAPESLAYSAAAFPDVSLALRELSFEDDGAALGD